MTVKSGRKQSNNLSKHSGQFKPGQSGNPNGRPPLSAEEKLFRQITKANLKDIGDLLLTGNTEELARIAEGGPDVPHIKAHIAKALFSEYAEGKFDSLNKILDRLIGKVKEEVDLNVMRPTIIEYPDGSVEELTAKPIDEK